MSVIGRIVFLILCFGVMSGASAQAPVAVTVIVFPSVQDLPLYAAQAKGIYARHGLNVDIKFTPNSKELRNGLAEGRYQIAHTAIDNGFALKDQKKADIVVVSGGDDSLNHLIVQPGIRSISEVKGKTVAVDAPNTAYAFQLYKMLEQAGVKKGEYQVKAIGGTPLRLKAMEGDKSIVAAMMNPPISVEALKTGMKDLGTTASALGAYQGAATFVVRKWAAQHEDLLIRYLQSEIEGFRWALDPKNKSEAVALLAQRLKLDPDIALRSYEEMKEGLSRDAALNVEGVDTVLSLRAEFEGAEKADSSQYIDLSYYQKALAKIQ